MKLIKFFSLVFAIAFLLSSCSTGNVPLTNEPENPDGFLEKTDEEEKENPFSKLISELPSKDFEGQKFRIATDNPSLVVSTESESIVGKEIYLRNKALEEKFNIKLTLTDESGLPTITERIKSEALAGTNYCDLVILESKQFQTLAASDSLVNIRSVPYLDTNGIGVHSDSLNATTLYNKSYGISGSFTYQPEKLFAVFYNKMLLGNTNLPNIYQLVNDNQWDFENFLLYAEEVYSLGKVNNVRVYGYSSTVGTQTLINALWAASGERFLANEYGTEPSLIYYHDTTFDFIDQVKEILFYSSAYLNDTEKALERFSNNETLFLIAPLSSAKKLSESRVKWGVVPIPKRDINQSSYYSYLQDDYCIAGFIKSTPDLEMSGMVTTAMFHSSSDLTEESFVKTYLNLYLSAPDDALMLKKIMKTPYYDPAQFFGQSISSYSAATQTLLYRSISSEGDFEALYDQYELMFNRYIQDNL